VPWPRPPETSLWRRADFVKLFGGETVSSLGGQVTNFALPLVAVVTLGATPGQMGLYFAAFSLSSVAVELFAGAWVDRLRRRRVLLAVNLVAALLVGSIPVAAVLGVLGLGQLYVVALLFGVVEPIFGHAFDAYLPGLVGRDRLVEANTRLEASWSLTSVVGPGVAGALVALLTAPTAMAVDAASFLFAAACVAWIRYREPPVDPDPAGPNIWREIGEGLRVTLGDPLLRTIGGIDVILGLFQSIILTIYAIFLVRELGFGPAALGLLAAVGALGFVVGASVAGRLRRRHGYGPTAVGASALLAISPFFLPFAPRTPAAAAAFVAAAAITGATGDSIRYIVLGSLRQAITPDRLLGRVGASSSFAAGLTRLAGALLGGALATAIGLRPTLLVGAAGHLLIFAWVFWSPLRTLREAPGEISPARS
jgi:MFS family permease